MSAPHYTLLSPDFFADPYPVYQALRTNAPVYWSDELNGWIITRYEDVMNLLRDPRLSSSRTAALLRGIDSAERETLQPLISALNHWIVFLDPPDHTRLRTILTQVFPPRLVTMLRPRIEALIDELLAPACAQGHLEVIKDLAYPLPAIIVAELLGAHPEDRDQIKSWSDDIIQFGPGRYTLDTLRRIQRGFVGMNDYFSAMLEARSAPPNTIVHELQALEINGELTREELLALCTVMLFAGHETTTNLIGNGLLTLLRHPEQWQQLCATPALIETAIEEILRYESPVQNTSRTVLADIDVAGVTLRAGERVVLSVGAANRDPEQFPDPDRFDIGRKPNRHITFGYGIHFCIGAMLARLEGQIALSTLLRRFPHMVLETKQLEWKPLLLVRELQQLRVRLDVPKHAELTR